MVADTGRRYRGDVIWQCQTDQGETVFKRSSRLTKIGKRLEAVQRSESEQR